MKRGILYAPDYVINAGGIIDVYHERIGFDRPALLAHRRHPRQPDGDFRARRKEARPTGEVADALAEERFKR
jgi:leucine dehydrogenase